MLLHENVAGDFFDRSMPEGENRFNLLHRATDEWTFLHNMVAVEAPGVDHKDLRSAAELRDNMILEWNRWVLRKIEEARFMVLRSHILDEAVSDKQRGVFFAPGEKVLLGFSCEKVLATVSYYPETLVVPGEEELLLYEREVVELHCFLERPDNDELRVLPVSLVPSVKVLPGDSVN